MPDADGRGVEFEAEAQLGVCLGRIIIRVAVVGGDGQGGAVAEGLLPGAAFGVHACGDLDGSGAAPRVVGAGGYGDGGGVDADVAVPAAQVPALLCNADGGQDQAVGQVLEAVGGGAALWGCPQRNVEVGVAQGKSGAAVVSYGVQGGGDGVQGSVEASAGGDALVGALGWMVRNAQPGAGPGLQAVGVGDCGAPGVVGRQQQPGQNHPRTDRFGAGPVGHELFQFLGNTGAVQKVSNWPTLELGILIAPLRGGLGRSNRIRASGSAGSRWRRITAVCPAGVRRPVQGRAEVPSGSRGLLLETAQALRDAYACATAADRVAYLGAITGAGGDVERAVGYRWSPQGTETHALRARVLLDVRAAGAPHPVAGLWTRIGDTDGLRAFAEQNRALGYTGMVAIHPSHVPVINEVFTPSPEELARAERLIAAIEQAQARGAGAVAFEGEMVDEARAATARSLLSRHTT
ncbi:HpcH/HpaI aldolase/citrate lyase family protein [Streptomyces aculeolatus]